MNGSGSTVRTEIADRRYCGKNVYESQSQANAKIHGTRAQSMSSMRPFAWILPKISALPALFPYAGFVRRNPGSD
jgi:hypothetical protein